MKIKTKIIILTTFFALIFSNSTTITGKVIDENGNPISGVNVYSGTTGTETQIDGSFILEVDFGAIIIYSHIGYNDVSILATDQIEILQMNSAVIDGKGIIVNTEFRNQNLFDTPASVSLFSKRDLNLRNENHFQYFIDLIPNLNYSSGTSRPRYFQIRGIGERSQYTGEGAPNFSVGYLIDGIDFSGIGMAGLLFDTRQIEVFKGPQSSTFGPNAMAGLINITSEDPTPFYTGKGTISIGSDQLKTYGYAFGGPLYSGVTFRLAIQKNGQNGYRDNLYRNINDSNKRDELITRTKLNWAISSNINLQIVHMIADLNNNYDAWAVDNNEELNTVSDQQGMDSQKSDVSSVKIHFTDLFGINVNYQYTASSNEIEHSYDGDWSNENILEEDYNWYEENPAFDNQENYEWGYYPWIFFDQNLRTQNKIVHDFRLSSRERNSFNWILGYYSSLLNEDDNSTGWLFGGDVTALKSQFELNNTSLYGQTSYKLNDNIKFVLIFRNETLVTDYSSIGDSYGYPIPEVNKEINHSFSGGKLAIIYDLKNTTKLFGSISRGYKAGGINQNPYLSETSRFYDPEYNTNLEAGVKFIDENLITNITLFSMSRTNQQVQISSQQEEGNSNSFFYYTSNASKGTNNGAELDIQLKLNNNLSIRSSLGILKTHVNSYDFLTNDTTKIILGDRDQAMAPLYNFSMGAHYNHTSGLFADFEMTSKDEYYFSDSHNQKSEAYQLLNLTAGYSKDAWSISLWGKNIFNTRYATRGFYFGNEPIWNESKGYHEYPDKLYLSYGDPLHYGLTVKYQF